jgi:hypothetical protein
MAISNKLWQVVCKTPDGSVSLPIGKLWILAGDDEIASRKAKRWLKNYNRENPFERRYVVKEVISHGTIDMM